MNEQKIILNTIDYLLSFLFAEGSCSHMEQGIAHRVDWIGRKMEFCEIADRVQQTLQKRPCQIPLHFFVADLVKRAYLAGCYESFGKVAEDLESAKAYITKQEVVYDGESGEFLVQI